MKMFLIERVMTGLGQRSEDQNKFLFGEGIPNLDIWESFILFWASGQTFRQMCNKVDTASYSTTSGRRRNAFKMKSA